MIMRSIKSSYKILECKGVFWVGGGEREMWGFKVNRVV